MKNIAFVDFRLLILILCFLGILVLGTRILFPLQSTEKPLNAVYVNEVKIPSHKEKKAAENHQPITYRVAIDLSVKQGNPEKAWLIFPISTEDNDVPNKILYTENGGTNWVELQSKQMIASSLISILDEKNVWIGNPIGEVWRTKTEGKTWEKISDLERSNQRDFLLVLKLFFSDEKHGWLFTNSSIWRTEDGGYSWEKSFKDGNRKELVTATFIGNNTGFVMTKEGFVHKTNDGGKTWNPLERHFSNLQEYALYWLVTIDFIDESTGWILAANTLYRTNDGGNSWSELTLPSRDTEFYSMNFLDINEGWLVGRFYTENADSIMGKVWRTFDGGQTWQEVSLVDSAGNHFPQPNRETYPWGNDTAADMSFEDIQFADKQHGWLVGFNNVYRTDDGGKTWRIVLSRNYRSDE